MEYSKLRHCQIAGNFNSHHVKYDVMNINILHITMKIVILNSLN